MSHWVDARAERGAQLAPEGSFLSDTWLQLEPLVAGLPDPVALVDPGGVVVGACGAGWGVPLEALRGSLLADWVAADQRRALELDLRAAVGGESRHTIDFAIPRSTTAHCWYQASLGPVRRGGAVAGVLVVVTDVSARYEAEARIRRREHLIGETERMAHLGTWEWDPRQSSVTYSRELYRIFGLDPAVHEPSYEDFLSRVHPDDRERVRTATKAVVERLEPYSHDERIQRADGALRYLHTWTGPLLDESGQLLMLVGVCQDITERKNAEREVELAEIKYRGLLESAPDGIVVVDAAGAMVIVNSQTVRMFGYAREALIGQPVEMLVPEASAEAHARFRKGYASAPVTRPMGAGRLLAGRRADGSEFPVEISLSPLHTEQGVLVTSIIRNVTDRRRADELIKSSLREKEVLLKEIHHRVKNNLQITSSLLNLQASYLSDARARVILSDSQSRVQSMALVHDKLYQSSDLSRIDLCDYVKSLGRLLLSSLGADVRGIEFKLIGAPVYLAIDVAVPCGLLLNELLSNCIKHAFPAGRSGTIEVTVSPSTSGDVLLKVRDNGVGLPEGVDLHTTDTLGLQLVRTLAAQLGAEIEVRRGGGTEFRVHFSVGD